MTAIDYGFIVVAILFVVAIGMQVIREWRQERRARNGRPWQALSPSAKFVVMTTDEIEAVKFVGSMGKVSFVDRDHRIIFFDTHLGGSQESSTRPNH